MGCVDKYSAQCSPNINAILWFVGQPWTPPPAAVQLAEPVSLKCIRRVETMETGAENLAQSHTDAQIKQWKAFALRWKEQDQRILGVWQWAEMVQFQHKASQNQTRHTVAPLGGVGPRMDAGSRNGSHFHQQ